MYNWQVHILTLPNEFPLYRLGKIQTVRIEFVYCGFTITDHTDRFDGLLSVGHNSNSAATMFRLKYDYKGMTIKRC